MPWSKTAGCPFLFRLLIRNISVLLSETTPEGESCCINSTRGRETPSAPMPRFSSSSFSLPLNCCFQSPGQVSSNDGDAEHLVRVRRGKWRYAKAGDLGRMRKGAGAGGGVNLGVSPVKGWCRWAHLTWPVTFPLSLQHRLSVPQT